MKISFTTNEIEAIFNTSARLETGYTKEKFATELADAGYAFNEATNEYTYNFDENIIIDMYNSLTPETAEEIQEFTEAVMAKIEEVYNDTKFSDETMKWLETVTEKIVSLMV